MTSSNGNGHRDHGHPLAVADWTEPAVPDGDRLDVGRLRAALLDVDTLCTLPPPEPLVGDVLVRDSVAVLYGKPGCGKSFVALDWSLCVATAGGLPWQGREVRGGKVLYVAAEGLRGLGRRVQAWRQAFRPPWPPEVGFYPRPLNLLDPREGAALVALAGEEGYALVVLDTFNRSLVGGDENSPRDVGIAIDVAVRVQEATGGTVLFVHHPGRNEVIRGHSSLDGAVNTMIEASGDPEGAMVLKAVKQKDAEEFTPIHLRREVVTLGDGSTSCVIRSATSTTDGELPDTERRLLAVLRDCFPETGARSGAWHKASDLPESSFHHARGALVRKGLVRVAQERGHPLYLPAEQSPSEPADA